MANLDLDAILPLVTHPIRYTGGELNCISVPGEDKRIRVALLLPDVYEIGMSNYGLRILYALLNRRPDTICERAYTPWPDMANRLRTSGIPLYSLESRRPLNTFHILGFSLQSELTSTNLLYTLELAGVPLHNHERTERHPLVIAGGPCCANPLPLRDFIDCFVIGDGEDVIQEIVATYRDWNRSHRADLLAALAQLESVYVPLVPARTPIRRRVKAVLSEAEFPFPPIVPIGEIIHDRLTLEIARGCCRGCRFCQAGVLNRPYRTRPQAELVRLAEKGIQASGWEEVSLLSLSALDYPGLLDLVDRLNSSLEKRRVAISLPSVRGEDFTPELAQALKKVHKTGLTFAPETASPRLRQMVNKDISEQKIIDSIQAAAQAGWTGVKLYFMIGLPGETDADVNEIGRFVEELGRIAKTWQVRFNLSPFVPKPHTPLQWCGFAPVAALAERLGRLRSGLRRRNVRAKWERPEVSCLQTALARGDTRLGPVIERAYRLGGIFQEWTEDFSFELWQRAFRDSGIDLDSYLRPLPLDQPLPWDFIDVGVSKEHLRAEHDRAQAGLLTPDCRPSECWACGIVNCPGTGRT
ncbi:MAG: TIGR03960 family B12-binding radical SAM protein, partial [candidate division WOR-3 bacterium]